MPSGVCWGAVWVCLVEGHMPASRLSTTGFSLVCVPMRLRDCGL